MPPKVFLSYSHDSAEHKDRVLAVCDRLRADGIDAWIDQYETSPPEGWPRWCANRVEKADFVLVVCTGTYERRFRGAEEPGRGLGGQWEGFVIYQELYESAARNSKFIPVLLPPAVPEHIPTVLRSVSRYELIEDDGYRRLIRHLTGQPETPALPLGQPVPLPPRERQPAEVFTSVRLQRPKPGEEKVNEKDGSVLVYVPGGEYVLGAKYLPEARPVHRVILSPFWIGKYPVTNGNYRRYLSDHPEAETPPHWDNKSFNGASQPVAVSWNGAQAYCHWAGLQLPTEAQWEAAARGTDQRRYPWGDKKPTPEHANFGWRVATPSPIGAFPRGIGPFGTLDQTGNVWEWCQDLWAVDAYQGRNGRLDPIAFWGEPHVHCLRGGSYTSSVKELAAAYRYSYPAAVNLGDFGFRCLLPDSPEPNLERLTKPVAGPTGRESIAQG